MGFSSLLDAKEKRLPEGPTAKLLGVREKVLDK
jgi:hypothetical protein